MAIALDEYRVPMAKPTDKLSTWEYLSRPRAELMKHPGDS